MSHPRRPTPLLLRILCATPLLLLAAFSCFGFLAAFELAEWSERLAWQVGYTLLGAGCLGGGFALLRPQGSGSGADADVPRR